VVTAIVLKKTNAYDAKSVSFCMRLITKWFESMARARRIFPANFDFMLFKEAVETALEVDNQISISNTLAMLYHSSTNFPIEKRIHIIDDLVCEDYFYRLLFHWSHDVREAFIAFILYQLDYNTLLGHSNFKGTSGFYRSRPTPSLLLKKLREAAANDTDDF